MGEKKRIIMCDNNHNRSRMSVGGAASEEILQKYLHITLRTVSNGTFFYSCSFKASDTDSDENTAVAESEEITVEATELGDYVSCAVKFDHELDQY